MLGILPDYSKSNLKVKIFNKYDIETLSDLVFINIEPTKDSRKIDREKFVTVPAELIPVSDIIKKKNKVNTLEKRNEIDGDSGKNIFEATGLDELDHDDNKKVSSVEDYDGDWQYMYKVSSRKYYWNKGKLYNVKDGKTDTEISKDEYNNILSEAKDGNEKAREKFIMMNVGLIYKIVVNQRKVYKKYSLSEQVSAGLEELNNCIDKYKLSKENPAKFSTFAAVTLQFKLFSNWLNTKSEIRVPEGRNSEISEISRAEKAVQGILENDSDLHFKVAKRLGVPYLKLKEKIQETMMYAEFVNFEDNLKEVEETYRYEGSDIQNVSNEEHKQELGGFLTTLTQRERMVFDLIVNQEKSLEEVAVIFDLTRESMRQVYLSVLRKLRHARVRGEIDLPDIGQDSYFHPESSIFYPFTKSGLEKEATDNKNFYSMKLKSEKSEKVKEVKKGPDFFMEEEVKKMDINKLELCGIYRFFEAYSLDDDYRKISEWIMEEYLNLGYVKVMGQYLVYPKKMVDINLFLRWQETDDYINTFYPDKKDEYLENISKMRDRRKNFALQQERQMKYEKSFEDYIKINRASLGSTNDVWESNEAIRIHFKEKRSLEEWLRMSFGKTSGKKNLEERNMFAARTGRKEEDLYRKNVVFSNLRISKII